MLKRLHVGLFSPSWPQRDSANGVVTYVRLMRLELLRQGHKVSVFSGFADVSESDGIFPVAETGWQAQWSEIKTRLRLQPGKIYSFGNAIATAVLARHAREPIDIFEMEESFGWFARVAARLPFPMIVKLHGPAFLSLINAEAPSLEVQKRITIEGCGLQRAHMIVAPSRSTLKSTAARYSLEAKALVCVPNPVESMPQDMIWRYREEQAGHILFVGRFDYRKGADAMLAAFSQVHLNRPKARLTFIGPDVGFPTASGEICHFDEYLKKSMSPQAAAAVRYIERCSLETVQALRLQAGVIVLASRWESFGYVVAESMSQGCPIVAFDVDGVNELLVDEDTGLLAPVNDVNALATRVLRVIGDRALAERLGARACVGVAAACGADTVAAKMLTIYQKACITPDDVRVQARC